MKGENMSTKAKKKCAGKKFRKEAGEVDKETAADVSKGRNWSDIETETFCRILADSDNNFCFTLETKALKKTANKEVFESIQKEFKISLLEKDFLDENRLYFNVGEDGSIPDLDISITKLRYKYNNLKKLWKKTGWSR